MVDDSEGFWLEHLTVEESPSMMLYLCNPGISDTANDSTVNGEM